jgi:HEAT repeat protein
MRKVHVVLVLLIAVAVLAGGTIIVALCFKSDTPATISYTDTLKNDKNPENRGRAARALGEMGPGARDAVPALLAALKDDGSYLGAGFLYWRDTVYVHDVAAKALVNIGGPETVKGAARLLSDPNSDVATRAAKILGQLGPSAKTAFGAILTSLRRDSDEFRLASLEALERIGLDAGTPEAKQAIPVLKESFQRWPRASAAARVKAIRIYRKLAPDDRSPIPALVDSLTNGFGSKNAEAFTALMEFGADALPPLTQGLSDQEDAVRVGAQWALSQLPPEQSLPLLRKLLTDASTKARAGSALVLGNLGPKAKEAVPDLQPLLADPDALVRVETAIALWSIDRQAQTCFPVLVDALLNDNEEAKRDAAQCLHQIGPLDEWAVEPLSVALKDKNQKVRLRAAITLGQIGPAAKKAMPALLAALEEPDQEIRLAVARALANVDPK